MGKRLHIKILQFFCKYNLGKVDKCIRFKGGRAGKIKGMHKKIAMADLIEELTGLPTKTQEAVLKNLSEEMIPLEIDGDIFMIHKNVSLLIDNLVLQISDLKNKEKLDVGKKND